MKRAQPFPDALMDRYAALRRAGKRVDVAAGLVSMIGRAAALEAQLRCRTRNGRTFADAELSAALEMLREGKYLPEVGAALKSDPETLGRHLRRYRSQEYAAVLAFRKKHCFPALRNRKLVPEVVVARVCAIAIGSHATLDEARAWALQFRPNARCMSVPEINALRRAMELPAFEVVVLVEAHGPGAWAAQHGLPGDAPLAVINSLRRRRKLPAFVVVRPGRSVEARAA